MNYADYWTKHHPELHHKNIQKEFLTPTIVIEMLRIEQQLQQKVVHAAWKCDDFQWWRIYAFQNASSSAITHESQVAVSATTAVYNGLGILCALATNTGLRLSDK